MDGPRSLLASRDREVNVAGTELGCVSAVRLAERVAAALDVPLYLDVAILDGARKERRRSRAVPMIVVAIVAICVAVSGTLQYLMTRR